MCGFSIKLNCQKTGPRRIIANYPRARALPPARDARARGMAVKKQAPCKRLAGGFHLQVICRSFIDRCSWQNPKPKIKLKALHGIPRYLTASFKMNQKPHMCGFSIKLNCQKTGPRRIIANYPRARALPPARDARARGMAVKKQAPCKRLAGGFHLQVICRSFIDRCSWQNPFRRRLIEHPHSRQFV